MNKKYIEPEMEIVCMEDVDIVASSLPIQTFPTSEAGTTGGGSSFPGMGNLPFFPTKDTN